MSKLASFVFGISIVGIAAAQAMPFRPTYAGLTVHVSSGCGLGVHRGPFDGCDPFYFGPYRSYFREHPNGYYDGSYLGSGRSLMVDQEACRKRGMYRACNGDGICWVACN